MSRRWPGWENLDGIDVAGGCAQALKQGVDYVTMRVYAGPDGANGSLDVYPVCFHADGHISVFGADDYLDCVVTDGMLTGIYHKDYKVTCKLVKCLFVQIPDGGAMPFLHYYLAGERADGTFANAIDAAIDCSPEESNPGENMRASASLTITLCPEEGKVITASWPLTPESGYAVLGLMRENHGAPAGQMMADLADLEESAGMVMDSPGTIVALSGHDHMD